MSPSSHTNKAREPSRRRGELRVAALLEAGARTFAEKGYQATTMTEVAARAGAAIGSLYQFFPSKESLAQALLTRFGEQLVDELRALADRAENLSSRELADAFIALRLSLWKSRSPALLLEEVPLVARERAQVQVAIRREAARALRALHPGLSDSRAATMAVVLLQLLKAVPRLSDDDPTGRMGLMEELAKALTCYLETAAAPRRAEPRSRRAHARR
jgi:AcrR family transcriptional regulator